MASAPVLARSFQHPIASISQAFRKQVVIHAAPFMENHPYQPIDCDLYDQLVLRAMQGSLCEIHYRDATGVIQILNDRILDVYSQNKAEFLRLSQGLLIRLDALTRVDGIDFNRPDRAP